MMMTRTTSHQSATIITMVRRKMGHRTLFVLATHQLPSRHSLQKLNHQRRPLRPLLSDHQAKPLVMRPLHLSRLQRLHPTPSEPRPTYLDDRSSRFVRHLTPHPKTIHHHRLHRLPTSTTTLQPLLVSEECEVQEHTTSLAHRDLLHRQVCRLLQVVRSGVDQHQGIGVHYTADHPAGRLPSTRNRPCRLVHLGRLTSFQVLQSRSLSLLAWV